MIKKVFKWMLRILLFLLALVVIAWWYFYFFPVYSDYWISEDYFETRFQKQWFNSPENGYEVWSGIPDLFSWVQWEVDAYSRCYVEAWDCSNGMLPEINDINKQQVLSDFLNSEEYKNEYKTLVQDVLKTFDRMLTYEYVSTLDYLDYAKITTGEEMKPVLTFTSFIQFSRSLWLYYDTSSNKDFIRVFSSFYKNISLLSNQLDSGLIDYLVIITILNTQFEYLENNLDRLNDSEKKLVLNILKEYEISNSMIQNASKAEYWEGKILFDWIFWNKDSWADVSGNNNIKTKLFYSYNDTMNLLRKNHYNQVNNICEENWPKKNGRNFLWRVLIQWNSTCYSSQYSKQKDVLQKREELIQLLSN